MTRWKKQKKLETPWSGSDRDCLHWDLMCEGIFFGDTLLWGSWKIKVKYGNMYCMLKVGKLHAAWFYFMSMKMKTTVGWHLYRPLLLNLYLTMLVISTEAAYCTALCWTVGHSKSGCVLCCTAVLSLWQDWRPSDLCSAAISGSGLLLLWEVDTKPSRAQTNHESDSGGCLLIRYKWIPPLSKKSACFLLK